MHTSAAWRSCPSVAPKLIKLGARLHMRADAAAAEHLPDTSYEDVAFITDRDALVRDADVVLDIMFGSDTSSWASTWIREDCL